MKLKNKIKLAVLALVLTSVIGLALVVFVVVYAYQALQFQNTSKALILESCLQEQHENVDFMDEVQDCKALVKDFRLKAQD